MRLWLDERRPAPRGWPHAHTYEEAKVLIEEHGSSITVISLDHDLIPAHDDGDHGAVQTVYDIQGLLVKLGLHPFMQLHTTNTEGDQLTSDLPDSRK
jgi:hypothetical protein